MNKIIVNGEEIITNGKNVSIINNKVVVDGKCIFNSLSSHNEIIIHGNCGNIDTTGNITINGDCNDIDTTGNVTIHGDVLGDVDSTGNVKIIRGDV